MDLKLWALPTPGFAAFVLPEKDNKKHTALLSVSVQKLYNHSGRTPALPYLVVW